MEAWLFDTDAISHLMRGKPLSWVEWVEALPREACFTSAVVLAELRYGALVHPEDSFRRRLQHQIYSFVEPRFTVLPLDGEVAWEYARARAGLYLDRITVDGNDLLIAATALANGLPVITDNLKDFSRVPGLEVDRVFHLLRHV